MSASGDFCEDRLLGSGLLPTPGNNCAPANQVSLCTRFLANQISKLSEVSSTTKLIIAPLSRCQRMHVEFILLMDLFWGVFNQGKAGLHLVPHLKCFFCGHPVRCTVASTSGRQLSRLVLGVKILKYLEAPIVLLLPSRKYWKSIC